MGRQFSRVEDAVEAISAGRLVIVLDSEDRENEGDFVAAAEMVTPQMVHLMISYGRGQLCVPVLPDLAARLELTPMVAGEPEPGAPRFTVPVDHRKCRTGISPLERAFTIRSMLDPANRAADYLRPGHVFPLVARPEGVLVRTGHTESAVDLARLAGVSPAGILCEICSEDGMHMATRDELHGIARELKIPMITIDALVEFRSSEALTSASSGCSA